jgi:hypothetical protein
MSPGVERRGRSVNTEDQNSANLSPRMFRRDTKCADGTPVRYRAAAKSNFISGLSGPWLALRVLTDTCTVVQAPRRAPVGAEN